MRYYKKQQAAMLHWVSHFLNKNREKLSSKSPAMKNFIDEFVKMEQAVYAVVTGNRYLVNRKTLEKEMVKREVVKVLAKIIAVLNASGYTVKSNPLPEMEYTVHDLKKLSGEKFSQTFLKTYNALKKMRNLQYYGLSEDDMKDMQAYFKEFTAVKNAPAKKKKEVAQTNKQVNDGVSKCIAYLKKHIDGMMLIAAEDDPALQRHYKGLRKVLPRHQGRPSDEEIAYRKSRKQKIRMTPEV